MPASPTRPDAPSLADVSALPIADRAEAVQRAAWASLNDGCATARGQGLSHNQLEARRLAWAIALRLTAAEAERCYLGRVGADRDLPDLIGRIRTADLAWAVASEQEPDGFAGGADQAVANRSFEELMVRDGRYVSGFARNRIRDRAAAEEASADAWHAFFCTYCRPGAPRRFLALSAIPSVLCTIIRRLAIKRGHGEVSLDAERGDDGESFAATLAVERGPSPAAGVAGEELKRLVLEAIESLPARQGLVTSLHLVHGMAQTEVADRLGCSRAYVSQTLSVTLVKVREYLVSRGWGPVADGAARTIGKPTLTGR